MRCEVLAIGTELLLGQIVDTNSAWIGEQLALAGIDCHYQAKVGDNQARIVTAIRSGPGTQRRRVCCGGPGSHPGRHHPRGDRRGVVGAPLERDPAIADRISGDVRAARPGDGPNNLRQAEVPRGADGDPPGPAARLPGLMCRLGDRSIYAVPGVPERCGR